DGRPAWETRAWHEIRARVAARAAAPAPRPRAGGDPSAAPLAAQLAGGTTPVDASSGEGNAEGWLDPVPPSPASPAATPPAAPRAAGGPARRVGGTARVPQGRPGPLHRNG